MGANKKKPLHADNKSVLYYCNSMNCGGFTGHRLLIKPQIMVLVCGNCNGVNNSWDAIPVKETIDDRFD